MRIEVSPFSKLNEIACINVNVTGFLSQIRRAIECTTGKCKHCQLQTTGCPQNQDVKVQKKELHSRWNFNDRMPSRRLEN